MIKKSCLPVFLSLCIVLAVLLPAKTYALTEQQLAEYWAPDIYHDVNDTYGYKADFITNFNFDGDWNGTNNWENLYSYSIGSYVYYSVVETTSHYFIGYYFYHPRDDGPLTVDKHENDMEGMIAVIRKDGSAYGSFQLMETVAHNEFYQYTNDSSITSGSDNVDGGVLFRNSHPKVFVQANGQSPSGGHGVYSYDGSAAPGGDGIVYKFGGTADVVTTANQDYLDEYSYELLSIDDFWDRRNNICSTCTFGDWGALAGDTYGTNSAKLPWAWDDSTDGATFKGDFMSDPAHLIDTHLNGLNSFSHAYVSNKYYTHRLEVSSVTSLSNRDPFGGKSDLYVKFLLNGDKTTDDRLWKKNNANTNTAYSVSWGSDDAVAGAQYSSIYNDRHVAIPPNTYIQLQIMDSDDGGDDFMGELSASPSVSQTVTWTDAITSNGEARVTAKIEAVR